MTICDFLLHLARLMDSGWRASFLTHRLPYIVLHSPGANGNGVARISEACPLCAVHYALHSHEKTFRPYENIEWPKAGAALGLSESDAKLIARAGIMYEHDPELRRKLLEITRPIERV